MSTNSDNSHFFGPTLGPTGLDGAMPAEVTEIQQQARAFARDVMRPLGRQLDRMPTADIAAAGSPIYDFFEEVRKAGLVNMGTLAQRDPADQAIITPVLMEELGWGDAGLGMLAMARDFAKFAAYSTGSQEAIQRIGDSFGCFLCTQPDRGSDTIDHLGLDMHPGQRTPVGNMTVTRNGSDYIINGQSSVFISGAPISDCAIAYAAYDSGRGFYGDDGQLNIIGLVIPFDEPGVTKGPALEKLGQRPLPQGAVFLDSVRLPKDFVVAELEDAHRELETALSFAKTLVATSFVGVARAAFDYSWEHVHQRRQGGAPLIRHQSVRARIFGMWRKLESSRSLVRRALAYHFGPYGPNSVGAITAKVHSTETAYELSQEAIRLYGGYGITPDYPAEKLLRDSQAALIEDGENNLLGLNAVGLLSQTYQRDNTATAPAAATV
ncbi:acyl-CoA dehydrogenase family protein [Streptomyces sp. NPDC001982]|uniref:acyl-CoA dehydrogenase family protein n=1 Tax=Streptomyces sp. NPDC001982 TaxID=3154405 RepID=UPI00331BD270